MCPPLLEAYGLFVKLEGFRKNGLVHFSQVSNHLEMPGREEPDDAKVRALGEGYSIGDAVWIKVVDVKVEMDGRSKVRI